MTLSRIVIDEEKKEQIIILKEISGERSLPIAIGMREAVVIRRYLSRIETARPMTHDLIFSILDLFGAKIQKIVIDDLQDNIFHAKLYLLHGEDRKTVDIRPSDAIALAIKSGVGIFAATKVFDRLNQ